MHYTTVSACISAFRTLNRFGSAARTQYIKRLMKAAEGLRYKLSVTKS